MASSTVPRRTVAAHCADGAPGTPRRCPGASRDRPRHPTHENTGPGVRLLDAAGAVLCAQRRAVIDQRRRSARLAARVELERRQLLAVDGAGAAGRLAGPADRGTRLAPVLRRAGTGQPGRGAAADAGAPGPVLVPERALAHAGAHAGPVPAHGVRLQLPPRRAHLLDHPGGAARDGIAPAPARRAPAQHATRDAAGAGATAGAAHATAAALFVQHAQRDLGADAGRPAAGAADDRAPERLPAADPGRTPRAAGAAVARAGIP